MYRRLVETSPEGVVLVDAQNPEHPVIYVNSGFEALTGYSAAELVGRNLRLLQGDDRDQDGRHRLREALSRGETCRVLLRNYRKDGTVFWNEMIGGAAARRGGTHHAFRGTSPRCRRAPADRSQGVARLFERCAPADRPGHARRSTDGAVHLAVPRGIVEARLGGRAARKRSIAVFAIDIDALDLYNATFGRAAGDSTIRRVAHVVSGCLRRSSDVTARIDGGSLIAFAPGLTYEQALRVGHLMAERVRDLRIHHPRSAVLRYISVSVGVGAMVPGAADSPSSLMQKSQQQLQLAKKAGRNQAA